MADADPTRLVRSTSKSQIKWAMQYYLTARSPGRRSQATSSALSEM